VELLERDDAPVAEPPEGERRRIEAGQLRIVSD
jgi:hypothetical protein